MTIFLATVLGWYLVIFSLFVLFRRDLLNSVVKDLFNERVSLFILALFSIIVGLMIIASHNIWVGWPIVVTLFGWLILLSGLLRLFFLDTIMQKGREFARHPTRVTIFGLVWLIVGLFLLFKIYFI